MDHILAQAIADKLGWTFTKLYDTYVITNKDDLTIQLCGNTARYNGISYVDGIGERVHFPSNWNVKHLTLSINFTITKGADKIAKDIERRLLPHAIEAHNKALEEKKRHDDYCDKIVHHQQWIFSCQSEFLKMEKKKNSNQEIQFTQLKVGYNDMENGYADIQIGSTISMNIHSLPAGAAMVMLTAWSDWIKRGKNGQTV